MDSSPVDRIDQVLCLSRRDLDSLGLEMIEIVDLLEEMFRRRASTGMVNPPKIFEHRSDSRFFSSMVAFAPAMGFASCKWQSGDADNPGRGLADDPRPAAPDRGPDRPTGRDDGRKVDHR